MTARELLGLFVGAGVVFILSSLRLALAKLRGVPVGGDTFEGGGMVERALDLLVKFFLFFFAGMLGLSTCGGPLWTAQNLLILLAAAGLSFTLYSLLLWALEKLWVAGRA